MLEKKELPKGWIKIKILEITKTKSGGTPARKNPDYFGGDIPWIKSGELNDSVLHSCEETITKQGLDESNASLIPKNTVLLAMYGATIGKVSILGFPAATNQAICSFFHNQNILHNSYLFYFFRSIRQTLLNVSFGGAQKNLSQEKINKILIPLPPLQEQHRIVQKIESIFAQIDACKARLERLAPQASSASGSLARLKSSVLKQAFEGRLVQQDPNDEPVVELLKRIGKNTGKNVVFKKEGLPVGWVGTKIQDLNLLVTKGTTPTTYGFDYVSTGINFVKVENLSKGMIQTNTITQFITSEANEYLKRSKLQENDILFSIAGTIGRVAIVRQNDLPANTNVSVHHT